MTALNKQILDQSPGSHVEDLCTERSHKEACGLIWHSIVLWFVRRIWNDLFLLSSSWPPKHPHTSGEMNWDPQWINVSFPDLYTGHCDIITFSSEMRAKEVDEKFLHTYPNVWVVRVREVTGSLLEDWRRMPAQRENQTTQSTNRFPKDSMLHLPSTDLSCWTTVYSVFASKITKTKCPLSLIRILCWYTELKQEVQNETFNNIRPPGH